MRTPCARDPLTLAVLAAELVDRTPLVVALEAVRERRALQMSGWIVEHYRLPPSLDFAAVSMILGVAVNYLAVRARTIRVMSGVKIETDDGLGAGLCGDGRADRRRFARGVIFFAQIVTLR